MGMTAYFRQVTPAELEDLINDPEIEEGAWFDSPTTRGIQRIILEKRR